LNNEGTCAKSKAQATVNVWLSVTLLCGLLKEVGVREDEVLKTDELQAVLDR
jgi:hypothetical protein